MKNFIWQQFLRWFKPRKLRIHKWFDYDRKERMMMLAVKFIAHSKLYGDYLEFGVFEGKSFSLAYHWVNYYAKKNRNLRTVRFYAFDSFEGLPDIEGIDKDSEFRKGRYYCSEEQFLRNLAKQGVDLTKVTTIKGFYKDTLTNETREKVPIKYASLIWIDCDLYESTVPILNFIVPYLQNGTLIVFDDWFCFKGDPDRGEQRATNEWLRRNPNIRLIEYHKFGWSGNSFIIKIKS